MDVSNAATSDSLSSQAKRSTGTANSVHCELCDVACTSKDSFASHLRGTKHLKVFQK
jgi:hypothetical protein